jgi:hypothetical protein
MNWRWNLTRRATSSAKRPLREWDEAREGREQFRAERNAAGDELLAKLREIDGLKRRLKTALKEREEARRADSEARELLASERSNARVVDRLRGTLRELLEEDPPLPTAR